MEKSFFGGAYCSDLQPLPPSLSVKATAVDLVYSYDSDPRQPLLEREFCELLVRAVGEAACRSGSVRGRSLYYMAFEVFAKKVSKNHPTVYIDVVWGMQENIVTSYVSFLFVFLFDRWRRFSPSLQIGPWCHPRQRPCTTTMYKKPFVLSVPRRLRMCGRPSSVLLELRE